MPPGTYRYDTAGSSSASGGATGSSPYPAVTTLTADPPAGSRQHTRRDLRDAHGNGPSTDEVLDYEADGIHLVELKVTTVEAGITYQEQFDPTPPPLVLRARPKVGDHLQFTMANPTTTAKVSIDVTGTSTVAVNGTSESCIAVHTLTTLSGEVSGTTIQDSCVHPSDNLAPDGADRLQDRLRGHPSEPSAVMTVGLAHLVLVRVDVVTPSARRGKRPSAWRARAAT